MKLTLNIFLYLLIFAVLSACSSKPDVGQLRNEILDLHNAAIRAHLDEDVEFFIQDISPNYFSAGKGKIRHPDKQEIYNQFSSYFSKVEFTEYHNLEEPLIGFSEDGSLAWSLVRVKVAGKRTIDVDSTRHFSSNWAWITLYKKEGKEWIRLGDVSSHD